MTLETHDGPGATSPSATAPERQAAYDRALRELAGRIHAFVPLALAAAR